jgi:anti-sigma28 factor (negative regulator of flagellin synthesis)
MATKKKTAKKKAAKTTQAAAKHKIEFALTPDKVAAIKRCLQKGTLKVTVSRADLLKGRIRDAWIYD